MSDHPREYDLANAVPATNVAADWLNAVQEELVNSYRLAGMVLDKVNSAQLLAAIQILIGLTPAGAGIWTVNADGAVADTDRIILIDGSDGNVTLMFLSAAAANA